MKVYYFLGNNQRDVHDVLNKIHIHLRGKTDFKSFFRPSELFLEGENYLDIVKYTTNSDNKIVGGFFGNLVDLSFVDYINNVSTTQNLTPDFCIVGSTIYKEADGREFNKDFYLLCALKLEGEWSEIYIENLNRSLISDMYKNILLGQIQKDFW